MKGDAIPKGWAVDKDGNDTVDCSTMYGIHPLGGRENTSGYKGYGLAVMVEMFCSMLSGSLCGYNMEVGVHDVDCVSHCFVAINPGAFEDGFHDRLCDMMTFCRNLDPVI
ncbi:delta(1)-pyrroline-2-carboxylate reductase 1-like [Ruditapes philippinarum]|uniref:delta(1)-pyrroline-2-carboxylate reductase 1-like n=1 Tax=Ruditapes philippinarum TaxID=129788 RepID=UPI00295B58C4|nr:delta(1)-pyrroline-2-carboxylate reductase 1-like [Ruditapes philippinarum]